MTTFQIALTATAALLLLPGCDETTMDMVDDVPAADELSLTSKVLRNRAAYIPPQCYTKTRDTDGAVHNPCYSCHVEPPEANFILDQDLQVAFDFPEYATKNHWQNLFVDRSDRVDAISDQEILDYVRRDNYRDAQGKIALAQRLRDLPPAWDYDGDGRWGGYIPDCHFDFDDQGFDRRPDGSLSGWRVFSYAPFVGTFWPTNGSTDDVLIRLPVPFRQDTQGHLDRDVYRLNLAIVETLIKQQDVAIDPVFEPDYDVDLDRNGQVQGMVEQVVYDWDPRAGRHMSYVGAARDALQTGKIHLAAGLYPEGTEFLHSVRYIDVDDRGQVKMAVRMKELRYARKHHWFNYSTLSENALAELRERDAWPDRLRQPIGDLESGVVNGQGWVYQGFIEDAEGALRPQSFEETVFCIGCHSGIGVTSDGTFAFPRKLPADSHQRGWYHWLEKDLRGTPEPKRPDGRGEYALYLEANGAADELRENFEAMGKFFTGRGELKPEMLETLAFDVTELIYPSRGRALELNKAYRVIVAEQSFWQGRDATITPAVNVHRKIAAGEPTGVTQVLW